jgi:hypothetical protein
MFMTLNFHKNPQRDFVFHFFFYFYYSLFIFYFFCSLFFFQHADVHATARWRIGSYAPEPALNNPSLVVLNNANYHNVKTEDTVCPNFSQKKTVLQNDLTQHNIPFSATDTKTVL